LDSGFLNSGIHKRLTGILWLDTIAAIKREHPIPTIDWITKQLKSEV
jgi:hypothetical protein